MEKTTYKNDNIEIVSIEKRKGIFKTEEGKDIKYTNYYVLFKHKDNALVYKAKVEKVFAEYMEDILTDAVAESDGASGFWEN